MKSYLQIKEEEKYETLIWWSLGSCWVLDLCNYLLVHWICECFSDQRELKQASSEFPLPHNLMHLCKFWSLVVRSQETLPVVFLTMDRGNGLLSKIPSVHKSLLCSSILIPVSFSDFPVPLLSPNIQIDGIAHDLLWSSGGTWRRSFLCSHAEEAMFRL